MMRKLLFLAGPALATFALFACEDSGSGSSSGSFTVEAGGFEASPPSEAGNPDVAVDAPVIPKTVTVTVVRGALPAQGISVVFNDAAGAVLETKTTGADGKATSTPGMSPAQASALLGSTSTRRIITWTSVRPGDQLLARDIGTDQTGTYVLTTDAKPVGAAQLTASIGGCSGINASSPVTVFMNTDCTRPTTAILARAFSPGGPPAAPLAYAFAKGLPAGPTDGGAGSATAGPWVVPTDATVTAKNLPADSNVNALLFEIADNLAIENPTGSSTALVADAATATFKVAPGFADAYQFAVRVRPFATFGASQTVAKRGAVATSTDVDLAALLPTLESADITTTTSLRPQVDWTTVGGATLNATDGGSVFISWYNSVSETNGAWTIIVAPGTKTVKAPALPASLSAWAPRSADEAGQGASFNSPTVLFVEGDIVPDYDAFRSAAALVLPSAEVNDRDLRAFLPATGTFKLTSFTPPGK